MATEIADMLVSPESAGHNKIPTLVIAHRHEIAGVGMEALLQAAGYSVVARCSHEYDLSRSVEAYRPDIIVLAENMVGEKAEKTVLRLRARNCSVAIILLLEERDVMTADPPDLDVNGILLSTACAGSIIDCIESVLHRHKWVDPNLLRHRAMVQRSSQIASSLTSREAEIAHLISRGLRNKEIAHELDVSESTVKMHLHHIYGKLGIGSRTQLVLLATGSRAPVPVWAQARPLGEPARPDIGNGPLFQRAGLKIGVIFLAYGHLEQYALLAISALAE